jgi:predicted dehydrogenase
VLQSLGVSEIAVLRQRGLPPRSVNPDSFHTLTTWEEAEAWKPEAAIICTPTSFHAAQTARCIRNGWHVLCEKPVGIAASDLVQIRLALQENPHVQLRVAYMLPFHPFMVKLGEVIKSGRLGKLLAQHTYWGEYLPDWHPWEDYRQSYAALQELGGGATLTLSHDMDLCIGLAQSEVIGWYRQENRASKLEIDTESASDVSISFEDGTTAHCHMSFHDRVPRRYYRFVFDNGVVEIEYLDGWMDILEPGGKTERIDIDGWERNDMFRAQWRAFEHQIIAGKQADTEAQLKRSDLLLRIGRG